MARDALTDLDAGGALKLEQVYDGHAPVMITHRNKRAMVMMSLEDYQALEETAYLLRSPKNATRLLESILELEKGGGTARGLIE
ncbi:MAG TPA: type II toxin-antitoxin system prevent-host-death family antitoxin [Candidatus Hydrogenedentes bacterium]|nr:type II toxin-antitoxin system prevent-host-death family antitoxin [Candidatus Hydrogenedentota bacterium]